MGEYYTLAEARRIVEAELHHEAVMRARRREAARLERKRKREREIAAHLEWIAYVICPAGCIFILVLIGAMI